MDSFIEDRIQAFQDAPVPPDGGFAILPSAESMEITHLTMAWRPAPEDLKAVDKAFSVTKEAAKEPPRQARAHALKPSNVQNVHRRPGSIHHSRRVA